MNRTRVARTTAVLAGATALGIAAGSVAFALWTDQKSFASSVQTGSLSLRAADAPSGTGARGWDGSSGSTLNYALPDGTNGRPANPLAALNPGSPVAVAFDVKSTALGRWGVDYRLGKFVLGGEDTSLVSRANAKLYAVNSAATCTTTPSGPALYSGTLSGFDGHTGVGVKGVKHQATESTQTYCLVLSVTGGGSYTNEVKIEGGSVSGQTSLEGSATWSASGEAITEKARQATLTLPITVTRTAGASH